MSGPVGRAILDVVKSREGRLYIAAEGIGGLLRGIDEEYTALAGPGGSVRVPGAARRWSWTAPPVRLRLDADAQADDLGIQLIHRDP
ncbi:hypothetical protein [Streptomyces sp. G7(2002)]|uniref:hypothetical protein n=1 Tax=Streptomyces sp. G7(2002) TaxID=2971798 RepID=UPI00237D3B25|nr:hypothetical protein [Streptomyces sp. G7(2002)]WDT58506.1 hypothetical protein NUT86_33265 [Streptomyces sp. G7(2002)]